LKLSPSQKEPEDLLPFLKKYTLLPILSHSNPVHARTSYLSKNSLQNKSGLYPLFSSYEMGPYPYSESIKVHTHNDLQIPFITGGIKRYSTIYYNRLIGHENGYTAELSNALNVRLRLKRQWPSDLKDQREEEG
jgi:hypothetical protein